MAGILTPKSRPVALMLAALGMCLVSSGCSSAASSIAPVSSAPPVAEPTTKAISSPSLSFAAEDAGLRLVASLDKAEVEPGGIVMANLALTNDRSTPVTFVVPCGFGTMTVQLPAPIEPAGEAWTGRKAAFKDYALKESQGSPMESSIRNPPPTTAKAAPCDPVASPDFMLGTATLAPGDTYETDLAWEASLVRDLPSTAGSMPFSIVIEHDPEDAGNGFYSTTALEVGGTITVLPGGPIPISAGQALDAAIRDKLFAKWLAKHPRKTWVNTNLFLQPGAIGVKVLPSVPYWNVELYAEPRSWVYLTVDAATGKILTHAACNVPCSR
jgi:hypothetical protein